MAMDEREDRNYYQKQFEVILSLGMDPRKIDERGLAKCIICKCPLGYRKRGKIALTGHCKSKNHTERVKSLSKQPTLPAACHGEKTTTEAYGIHPMFIN
jgi:hypothetical protein